MVGPFCVMIAKMVTWIYTCVRIHRKCAHSKQAVLLNINLKIKIKKFLPFSDAY